MYSLSSSRFHFASSGRRRRGGAKGKCRNTTCVPCINSKWSNFLGFFFFLNIHILLIPLKCIFFLDEDFFRKFLEVDQIHKRDQMTFFSILSCPANSVCYSLHLQSSGHLVKTTRFLCSSYICLQWKGQEVVGQSWQGLCSASCRPFQTSTAYLTLCWTLHSRVDKG